MGCIGHCHYLWNPPLQPIHHSQQSYTTACICFTINDFAVQAEMVAVETFIGVGNNLWIFYDCLSSIQIPINEDLCQSITQKKNLIKKTHGGLVLIGIGH